MAQQTLTITHKLGNLKFNPPDPHKEESANSTELPSDPHAHTACTHTNERCFKVFNIQKQKPLVTMSHCHTSVENINLHSRPFL